MAISAPIETKDELVETGLEVLGAQPVTDAPRPALEVAERGVDPGENFMGRPVADDMGLVAVPSTVLQPLQPSVLMVAVAAVLRTTKLPRSLALQDRIVASRRRPGALPSPSSTAPAIGILPSGLRPGPGGAPLSRCGRLASSISTRPGSGLRSGVAMARRSLAASIQALRQYPIPSRFCNCRAEMPLQ